LLSCNANRCIKAEISLYTRDGKFPLTERM